MTGHTVLALVLTLSTGQLPPAETSGPLQRFDPMASETMRNDARLADVCFVDARHGWAVGDRGTIWHTDDGGEHWHLQRSGVACPLESVWFVDEKTGWAAGGFSHPYTHGSSGVVLVTSDGGRHWHHQKQALMPALKQVRFFDKKHGWAVGCPSSMYPTGVFTTDSGGRSWRPVTGEKLTSWLAGDFINPHTGALVGRNGTAAMVQRGGIEPTRTGGFGLRNLARVKLVAPVHGWLIGDGGLIMMTGDLGASWQTPPGELPRGMAAHFDFAALAVRGPRCWIAGTPGTQVFHTADAGRTWTARPTGTNLPIHALAFVDDNRGWAVGALGTILATEDGGQTWRRQRSGGTRVALLAMFAESANVPLELFARLSANEGYLGVVEVLNRRDVEIEPAADTNAADRLHEAAIAVGASDACTTWRFPLRQAGLGMKAPRIIDVWDQINDARGLDELQRHIVRRIRLWRPEVIVTHDASPRGDDPLGHLVNQVVLHAVEKASDATSFTGQITDAGLEPWQVKKVYAALPPPSRGSTELTTAALATRLGRSLTDVAAGPRGLLEDRYTAAPSLLGFRLLVSHLPRDQRNRDFFSGIVLHPGGDARRELLDPLPEGLEALRRTAQQRRNSQAILEQAEQDPRAGEQLLAQAGTLIRGLPSDSAGRILYQLGQQYYRNGRWQSAAEAFELLTDRYGDHPLSRPALLWLVQYYSGGEAAWRIQGKQRYAVQQTSAISIDASQQEDRPGRASQLGKHVEQTRPELFADPALRFPLAVAHRKQGFPGQAERFYLSRSHRASHEAWRTCARGEQWLAKPEGLPPKPVLTCTAAREKPRLDGKLDDAVWRRARPAPLQSVHYDDAQWSGSVMLAYDAEFLYIAVNCRRAPGAAHAAADGPRPRDPDLSGQDRVEVLLDLDRDYASYYRLTIDHRGWVADGCWGDRTWNPNWFVAAAATPTHWTAEAAVPLEQLTGSNPGSRDVWAVGIQRTVPGVGFQSWSKPASTSVRPEGFGYLIFE